ncbi:MAG: hypothetical protein WCP06_09230 [Verrucomicrobiota bacterium]
MATNAIDYAENAWIEYSSRTRLLHRCVKRRLVIMLRFLCG